VAWGLEALGFVKWTQAHVWQTVTLAWPWQSAIALSKTMS